MKIFLTTFRIILVKTYIRHIGLTIYNNGVRESIRGKIVPFKDRVDKQKVLDGLIASDVDRGDEIGAMLKEIARYPLLLDFDENPLVWLMTSKNTRIARSYVDTLRDLIDQNKNRESPNWHVNNVHDKPWVKIPSRLISQITNHNPDNQVFIAQRYINRLDHWNALVHTNSSDVRTDVRQLIINSNLRLVVSIAKEYIGIGIPFADLIQYGNQGLVKGVDKLDPSFDNKIGTYVTWWIRREITSKFSLESRHLKIPIYVYDEVNNIKHWRNTRFVETGNYPGFEETYQAFAETLTYDNFELRWNLILPEIYLNQPIRNDTDVTYQDFLVDKGLRPEQAIEIKNRDDLIEHALALLTPRKAKILRMRFGLGDYEPHTLEELSKEFGLTKEGIRQIELDAVKDLRTTHAYKLLQDFLYL